MKIDAHLHVNYHNLTIPRIIKYLDKHNFDCCWLMTWEEVSPSGWHNKHLSVEDVYEAYSKYPSRIIPMYAPDPHREDASQALLDWHKKGIRGCAELKSTTNWLSPRVRRLLDQVSRLRLPLLFHMEESRNFLRPLNTDSYLTKIVLRFTDTQRLAALPRRFFDVLARLYDPFGKWKKERTAIFPGYMLDFASLETTLIDYPSIVFIGHGPLFWKNISAEVQIGGPMYPRGAIKAPGLTCRLLRSYPNLYADISGGSGFYALTRDPQFAKRFLVEFSDKILYGTDNAFVHQEIFLESLKLPASDLRKIKGDNAYKLVSKASDMASGHDSAV